MPICSSLEHSLQHRYASEVEPEAELEDRPQASTLPGRPEVHRSQTSPGEPSVGASGQQWERPTESLPPTVVSPRSDSAASLTPPDWRTRGAEPRPASKPCLI